MKSGDEFNIDMFYDSFMHKSGTSSTPFQSLLVLQYLLSISKYSPYLPLF